MLDGLPAQIEMLAAISGSTAVSCRVLETLLWLVLLLICLLLSPPAALVLFILGSSNPTCGQAVRAALLMFLVDLFGSLVWLRYQLYQGLRACLHHHGAEVVELPAMVNDDVGAAELGADAELPDTAAIIAFSDGLQWRLLGQGGHTLSLAQ